MFIFNVTQCLWRLKSLLVALREGLGCISLIMVAIYREKSAGANTQPCLWVIGNRSERTPRWFTQLSVPLWSIQIRQTKQPRQPNFVGLRTLLKPFWWSQRSTLVVFAVHDFSLSCHIKEDNVDSASWKPETTKNSQRISSIMGRNQFSSICAKILPAMLKREMPW